MKQYLEQINGKSSKFWEIELDGQFHSIRHGKVGSKGKSSRKDLKSPEKALIAFKRQVAKKIEGGYLDPEWNVAVTEYEQSPFNDKTFEHGTEVKQVHYFAPIDLVLSSTGTSIYLWTKEGQLLDDYIFGTNDYFWGEIFFKEIPNSSKVLCYIKDTDTLNHLMLMDLSSQKLDLVKEIKLTLPTKGYYGDLDISDEHIYLGYTNGFMLLDYDFNILKTIESPQEQDNSSGVAVNAKRGLIAFVQYVRNEKEPVVVVDLEGKVLAEFESKAHGSSGMNLCFNEEGTRLYLASSSNYETKVEIWDIEKGALEKSLINYSSRGHVLSFSLRSDEKYLAIRVAGIDLIFWNIEDERVEWVKQNQALNCSFSFAQEAVLYQSFGNRLGPISLEDGRSLLELKALSGTCNQMYYDDDRAQLWLAGGKRVICFDQKGNLVNSLDATTFIVGSIEDKILLERRSSTYMHCEYAWLDLSTAKETPLMCESFKGIDFNEDFILSTEGYFSQKNKATRMWSHAGKMKKALKPKKDWSMRLLGKERMVLFDGKKVELWNLTTNSIVFLNKTDHTKPVEKVLVHHNQAHFISAAGTEMNFWNDEGGKTACFEVLAGKITTILTGPSIADYILLTENGYIYSFDPNSQVLRILLKMPKGVSNACLSNGGVLYVSTLDMEVLKLDLSPYLVLEVVETTPVKEIALDLSPLQANISEKALLTFVQSLGQAEISDSDFKTIRNFLNNYATKNGIVQAHQAFTAIMLERGGQLKHEFAHEEENSSFAMSSDGQYLAVGTWVGDNYKEDGTLQIWELASGRCVNLLKGGYGGIGWPDYPFTVQWSPDNSFLGAAFNTNSVGKLNPFSSSSSMLTDACVTDGWSRPPAWCWLGNDALVVSCWHNSEIPACICKTNQLTCYEGNAKWFAKKIDAKIKGNQKDFELQPFKWCQANKEANLIYGYNGHNDVFAIDVEQKNLAWYKSISGPKGFSSVGDFFVYKAGNQFALASIETGADKDYIRASIDPDMFEFALNSERFAAYTSTQIVIYDYKKEVATINLTSKLKSHYFSDTELRSVRFNLDGTQMACLLENNNLEIWDLKNNEATLIRTILVTGTGVYWGEQLVVVGPDSLLFLDNHGKIMNTCDKQVQVEAYNELYGEVPSPLVVGKKDLTSYFELQPLYPLKYKGKSEWLLATSKGLVVSTCKDPKELDQHLSYTWNNKFAWPYLWGADAFYEDMASAKNDKKLPFNAKERALFKATKKKKKRGIDFSQAGSVLDVIDVHQKSISNLSSGWNYHVSRHNGVIAKKLVELGAYERAIKVADNSPEWYVHVSNLGFLAIDLVKKGALDFAKKAFDRGVEVLSQKDKEDARTGWGATFVYAPLAAAAHLLGDIKTGEAYFKLAEVEIKEESNAFEKYAWLATSYLAIDAFDKALDIMKNGPWSGSWFTSYQVKFMLSLLDLGRLDLAMEYFDLAIEKCGKIDEFDLLDGGFDALLAIKKYDDAIAWMKRFPGLSTSSCEERLIQVFIKDNELERAKKYLLNILENNEWPDTIMENVLFMSFVDPVITQEYLTKLKGPLPNKVYYKADYFGKMGAARARINMLDDALDVLAYAETDAERLAYLTNLLLVPNENTALQVDCLEKAIALLDSFEDGDENKIGRCLKVAKAAKAIGQLDQMELLLEKAKTIAKNSSEDKRYTYNQLQDLYLEMDLLEEAYAMLKKQTPSRRKYMMKDFVFEVGKRGCWKAATELLLLLPDEDLNDRLSAALDLIEKL